MSQGSLADVVVYEKSENAEEMFAQPKMVFRRGKLVFRDGVFLDDTIKSTLVAVPSVEPQMDALLKRIWKTRYGYSTEMIAVQTDELRSDRHTVEVTSQFD